MEPLIPRRRFLGMASLVNASYLAPIGEMLARAAEKPAAKGAPAQSLILLWMQGGPSQMETFDPHPNSKNSGGTKAIKTRAPGIQLASGLPQLAEQMDSISLIRSMMSKEGDHERGSYTMKTGFRPDPTIVHPSIGAIIAHELEAGKTEIPRHVSILSSQWPGRGGHLGDKYSAFLTDDPAGPVPDTRSNLTPVRDSKRLENLDVIEAAFARGRERRVENTLHRHTVADARKMMSSAQLKAFDVSQEPIAVRKLYGETPFGRGCLAARRLIEVGVRCVEVNLTGWDTHVNNGDLCAKQNAILDPAFAALISDLKERKLLDRTMVVCAGEFGRTPSVNPAGGRDHWPTGFSVALAGGGIRGGQIIGETNPDGAPKAEKPGMMMDASDRWMDMVKDPVPVENLNATILTALGIEHDKLNQTPIGRTVKFNEGKPIAKLLS